MRVELRATAGQRYGKHPETGRLGIVHVPGKLLALAECDGPESAEALAGFIASGHVCVVAAPGHAGETAPAPAAPDALTSTLGAALTPTAHETAPEPESEAKPKRRRRNSGR